MLEKLIPLSRVQPISVSPSKVEFEFMSFEEIDGEFYITNRPCLGVEDRDLTSGLGALESEFIKTFVSRSRPQITRYELLDLMQGLDCQAIYRSRNISFSPNIRSFPPEDDEFSFAWSKLDDGRDLILFKDSYEIGQLDIREILEDKF